MFDTGSSELPLSVDLETWRRITGRSGVDGAPKSYEATAWGKPVRFAGAPAPSAMRFGALDLDRPVFTDVGRPEAFAHWPFRSNGVRGNAAVWDDLVVLDLMGRVGLGPL